MKTSPPTHPPVHARLRFALAAISAVVMLFASPVSALRLQWSTAATNIEFSSATRCTLVVEADSTERVLPQEWRLLWVARDLPGLTIVPESSFDEPSAARVASVHPPVAAEADARLLTAIFACPGSPPLATARWILDLPGGSAGKFVVCALRPGLGGTLGELVRSEPVTFNGGVPGEFPPQLVSASGDHTTSKVAIRALGTGLAGAASASLVAADTSWQVPLTITEATDSTLSVEAEVPTQLPDGYLQVSVGEGAASATALPASQVLAPQVEPVTIVGNSFLVPPDSIGISPKDFAFVYSTVPTSTPGVWRGLFHLFYIRHYPNGQEWNLGHAWSPDLQNWTFNKQAFGTGPTGSWDAGHVWAPSIVQNGNHFYMFYAGVDAAENQRIGRVTTDRIDTNTVWSVGDRKMVYAADSTSWVARHPSQFTGADQLRDPFVFADPDSSGRYLMVCVGLDTNYKAQYGMTVGLARNRPGTMERWLDLGRYEATDWLHNGYFAQVESPTVIPDSGYVPPYAPPDNPPTGWRLAYTWGGNQPTDGTQRVLRAEPDSTVSITRASAWGATQTLYGYLGNDETVRGWNGLEHLKAGNVDYIAGYNAYLFDGIQIARLYWNGPDFSLRVPTVSGIDEAGSGTAAVRLAVPEFDPRARRIAFEIDLPTAMPVKLELYDVSGRRLRTLLDRLLPAGESVVHWDHTAAAGERVASGVYFARLTYASGSRVARLPFIR